MPYDEAKTFRYLQEVVQAFYTRTWAAWFATMPHVRQDTLRFAPVGAGKGY